jgi:MerR family transcriptional regulator, heat shock protein HspR
VSTSNGSPSPRPLYSISVAAELTGLPLQTLRLYEEKGLVTPARTPGGTRRFSDADVDRIRRVATLVDAGVTLSAVGMVLELQDDNADLVTRNRDLRARNSALRRDAAQHQDAAREQDAADRGD